MSFFRIQNQNQMQKAKNSHRYRYDVLKMCVFIHGSFTVHGDYSYMCECVK